MAETRYHAVSTPDTESADSHVCDFANDDEATQIPEKAQVDELTRPQVLPCSSWRILSALPDALVGLISLAFVAFGLLVLREENQPLKLGSLGDMLLAAARYGPTIFTILFAAVVGRAMKAWATWRLQQGSTIGMIEQLVGSSSISSAFITQTRLRVANIVTPVILVLWSLSPLGSQASLRIIYTEPYSYTHSVNLTALDPFSLYHNGIGLAANQGDIFRSLLTSSMISSSVSSSQGEHQDLWGNLKIPFIEHLERRHALMSDWVRLTRDKTTLSANMGIPIDSLPTSGTTNFILPSSYLSVSCSVFTQQSSPTNITALDPPKSPFDCSWYTPDPSDSFRAFQLAISLPCPVTDTTWGSPRSSGRKIMFDVSDARNFTNDSTFTHAECDLITTYVDLNVTCSQDQVCATNSIRRRDPPLDPNWTAFDLTANSTVLLDFANRFSGMFADESSDRVSPIVLYLGDKPIIARRSGGFEMPDIFALGPTNFETRLTQLINSQYLVGIDPLAIAGSFSGPENAATKDRTRTFNVTNIQGTTTIRDGDILKCDKVWLVILLVASGITFLVAVSGVVLRATTTAPDVLGSLSLGMMENISFVDSVGPSVLDGEERAKRLRYVGIRIGDVAPLDEVGKIGLAIDAGRDPALVGVLKAGRFYG